jgi:hypothetical protein
VRRLTSNLLQNTVVSSKPIILHSFFFWNHVCLL